MSNHKFTENSYEQALISLFRDELGYEYIYGPDIERDYSDTLQKCRPVTKESIRNEKLSYRMMGLVMKILAPLM